MTRIFLSIAMLMGLAAPVMAQGEAAPGPARPYRADPELRQQCEAELAKDRGWQADLENQLRPKVHQDDATVMLKNKRHVVMAYAALWVLTAAFLVLLWLRQRRLLAEIDRLGEQVKKAAES